MQDSESWREKVARIIDLEAFLDRGPWASDRVRDTYLKRREAVLAKADAILSALSAAPLPVGGGKERDSGADVAAAKAPVSPQERHPERTP